MGEQSKPNRIETIKAKYGEDYFKRIGQKGGKKLNSNKGFGCGLKGEDGMTGHDRAVKCGKLSRRKKNRKEEQSNENNNR